MHPAQSITGGPSLLLVELGLTIIAMALAFLCPAAGQGAFGRVEQLLGRLARRRTLAICVVGLTAALLRLCILPLLPIPQPAVHNDFSFLLGAETFASGRLTNPTHPMWAHFESFHITQQPTYMSMYFPAQAMVLAAGKLAFGHPWWGVWASVSLMCAVICWMLQAWLPPNWALLGGMLAVIRLALFSYWGNSYFGGAIPAIGGALVLGAMPRLQRGFRARDFFWLALGMAVLANSRPYEGLLVCLPAVAVLCWWLLRNPHPAFAVLARRAAPACMLLLLAGAFMAYYNYRVFGNPLTPPYSVDRKTYATAPYFIWETPRPEPVYRHKILRDFYSGEELPLFLEAKGATKSLPGILSVSAVKLGKAALFYPGIVIAASFFMLPWALGDRRIRLIIVTAAILGIGLGLVAFFIPHYLAPFTAGGYAITLQCMRHLRVWRPDGQPRGMFLVRACVIVCLVLAIVRLTPQRFGVQTDQSASLMAWYGGTTPVAERRPDVLGRLERYPGRQLAIVRYGPGHSSVEDWVYNAADIDRSRVVWAREMDTASNLELFRYFKDRNVWLVEPDKTPPAFTPYPGTEVVVAAGVSR